MRLSTLSVSLFAAFAAAILALSLFSPIVRIMGASSNVLPAERVLILQDILSGYATVNKGADHIVGIFKPAVRGIKNEPIDRIYPDLDRIPITGTNDIPDPEQVLRLRPDVVLISIWQARYLDRLGLPGLLQMKYDAQNPIQSREEMWNLIGDVTGKRDRATTLEGRYIAKRRALQGQLPSIAEQRVRVVYVHVDQGTWWTTAGRYYLAYKLELAGAINASKDIKFTGMTDLEQLLLIDPDVILLAANPGDHTTMQEVVCRPEFRSLRAMRERRVYKLPAHTYMNEPVEDPLLLRWMAEVFYPARMPLRLRDEYKETYQEVYGYAISDDEIDGAIFLEENLASAGYERFTRRKPPT